VGEAALQASLGQTSKALPLYQSALQIDTELGDRHSAAIDWYMYAVFLRSVGFPSRFAYASLLKSQELFPPDSNDQNVAEAKQIRKELEQQLGPQVSAVSSNTERISEEALELKR
jgi:hypothetical protein